LKAYSEKLAYTIEELTNCAHEPIASCGAIQSVGYYINIHAATALIEAVSTNFAELLGLDTSMILGKPISDFLKLKDGLPLDFSSKEMIRHKHVTQLLVRDLAGNAIVLSANFFEEGTQVGIDLEPAVELPTFDTNRNLHSLISRLESSEELATDCLLVCEAIRSLAGFDRVMVYRFQENWDGEVIAEARDESLVPFLHLRYPAHDIPEQARKLYLRTPYRMIVDTEAVPVVVQTLSNRSRMDVSLGLSHLRASSPIHIQYLHNMGVRSSFSIPLKVNNRLWGLISCHHNQEALYFNPERRSSLELMGRLLSGRVASFIEKRRILTKRDTLEFTQSFVNNLTLGMPTRESFLASREQLMNLIRSTGAFIRVQGENIRIGS
ncbi:MAG: GAF domain-containing protein, partial [Proteobacteria bacterium]